MMESTTLLIVVPCYNEEEVLYETTRQLTSLLGRMEQEGKIAKGNILYVDDGSKDATWEIIEKLGEGNGRVCGLKLAHNVGHQQALWAGLEWGAGSSYDAIVSIDADLQDDVEAISEMADKFNRGYEIVYGVRKERKTDTFFKKHTAQMFYKFMKSMGGDVVYNHADFRLMSNRALNSLVQHPERNLFLRGMVRSLGYRQEYVYYDRKERFAGESKYPLSKMLSFAVDGITSFSIKPLRLITSSGVVFMLVAVGIICWALYSFIAGKVVPGWTSLLVSVWFIGGAMLTATGIIGEYIGKIYKEVKRRPRYFVEKTVNLK